jgi:hypothetical protein
MFLLSPDYWEVKGTVKKGRGVFAKKDIEPGVVIGDYIGRVVRTAEEDTLEKDGQIYLMYYHDRASLFPDIKSHGVHLFNHSCTPNSWIKAYRGHNIFFSLRHIFAGEELTASYLLSPQEDLCGDDCPHVCHCGSKFCSHTMHMSKDRYDKWNDFEIEEMKKTKRQRITYGKTLPLLSDYPENVSDDPIFTLFGNMNVQPEVISGSKIPSPAALRKIIRETGRTVQIKDTKLHIYGVANNKIVTDETRPEDLA